MPRPAPPANPRSLPKGLPPIAVVVSRYNASITDLLLSGAVRAYTRAGGRVAGLYVAEAPGAFEILPLAAAAARSGHFAGVVAIGCIIKGETIHDEVLAHAVTGGLANLAAETGVPVGLAVLTVHTPKQAAARAGGRLGNKGQEAMEAVLQTMAECALLADGRHVRRAMLAGQAMARVAGAAVSNRPDKARRAAGKGRARGE
ncbi:MAG: 6,7-dimethyl-8-ribityllumazine synthase [Phycisphaerales bacterium]